MKSSQIIAFAIVSSLYVGVNCLAAEGADGQTDAQSAALHKTIETCGVCHGVNGRSVSPTFPNLAAQTAPYIEAQLHAFKDQTRADPDAQAYMWGMASPLSDATISGLANYFSSQPPAPGRSGNAALIEQGKRLFEEGVPAQQIPPCASCHGAHAAGMATFPRLAGQHAPYLLKQLLVIQSVLRTAPVMHGVVKNLSREQMQALVAYLESI
ncbi:MAG TPA: c-type cytochrome [Steroidobacteraceae bacterium]|nr:c-type cytochrome [Steroidobacteraceae bacterium]